MPRKLLPYKKFVSAAAQATQEPPSATPCTPPATQSAPEPLPAAQNPNVPKLDESQLAIIAQKNANERAEAELEARLGQTKIPHKILTPMELRSRAIALMNERGYDPIRELIKIARNQGTEEDMRVKIHIHLAKFVYPEQKAVDLQVQGDLNVNVTVMKFTGTAAANREAIPVRAVEVERSA